MDYTSEQILNKNYDYKSFQLVRVTQREGDKR